MLRFLEALQPVTALSQFLDNGISFIVFLFRQVCHGLFTPIRLNYAFGEPEKHQVELGPGDALLLPRWWWHQSEALSDGHAINWWPPGATVRESMADSRPGFVVLGLGIRVSQMLEERF